MSKGGQGRKQPKKSYVAPRLVSYGALSKLTHAGTRAPTETGTGMMMPSSRAVKENLVRVGTHPLGIGLYLFDYKPGTREIWGGGRQFGVIAEDVEAILPEAVSVRADGCKLVDYAMLGIERDGD